MGRTASALVGDFGTLYGDWLTDRNGHSWPQAKYSSHTEGTVEQRPIHQPLGLTAAEAKENESRSRELMPSGQTPTAHPMPRIYSPARLAVPRPALSSLLQRPTPRRTSSSPGSTISEGANGDTARGDSSSEDCRPPGPHLLMTPPRRSPRTPPLRPGVDVIFGRGSNVFLSTPPLTWPSQPMSPWPMLLAEVSAGEGSGSYGPSSSAMDTPSGAAPAGHLPILRYRGAQPPWEARSRGSGEGNLIKSCQPQSRGHDHLSPFANQHLPAQSFSAGAVRSHRRDFDDRSGPYARPQTKENDFNMATISGWKHCVVRGWSGYEAYHWLHQEDQMSHTRGHEQQDTGPAHTGSSGSPWRDHTTAYNSAQEDSEGAPLWHSRASSAPGRIRKLTSPSPQRFSHDDNAPDGDKSSYRSSRTDHPHTDRNHPFSRPLTSMLPHVAPFPRSLHSDRQSDYGPPNEYRRECPPRQRPETRLPLENGALGRYSGPSYPPGRSPPYGWVGYNVSGFSPEWL